MKNRDIQDITKKVYKELKHENLILYNRLKKSILRNDDAKETRKRLGDIFSYYIHFQNYVLAFGSVPDEMKRDFKDIAPLIKTYYGGMKRR